MNCTCLACLEGVRIAQERAMAVRYAGMDDADVEALGESMAGRVDRMAERAERLAKQYRAEHEIRMRMPADWRPERGWFAARGIEK